MRRKAFIPFFLGLVLAVAAANCGGSPDTPNNVARTGDIFVIGTDAPLGSVLAFKVTLTGLTVSGEGGTASLIDGPQDVEFARLHGLRTLLSLRSVQAGTYNRVNAVLSSPVISFLDTSTTPPSVGTLNGQLVNSSVTVELRQPLVLNAGDLLGLFLDFRLRESLEVDATGQLTGRVDPHVEMRVIPPDTPEAEIDELRGGVVSVDVPARSFVMQGPHGRTLTVTTDDQTQFEEGEGLDTLNSNAVVEVSGFLQRQSKTLRASEVQVLSRERFLVGGLITHVRPAPGLADEVDLLVRTELPDLAGVQVGRIATFGFNGNERFMIHHLRMPLAHFLFNRASLVAGQRITMGGSLDNASPPAMDVRRVMLHVQGLEGNWVPGSTRIFGGNNGSFAFRTWGLTGLLFERPVRVFTSERTRFVNLDGLAGLAGDQPMGLRVVGLVLLDHLTNEQVIIARVVHALR